MKKLINYNAILKISLNDFNHMQEGYSESLDAVGKALSNVSDPVILWGCAIVNASTSYALSAGAIYYAGEIFQVSAANSTFTALPFWAMTAAVDTSKNPLTVQRKTGTNLPVHIERKFALSTSGVCKWNEIRQIDHVLFNKIHKKDDTLIRAVDPVADFDVTGLGKIYTRYEGWAVMNGSNGTVDMGGFFPVGQKNTDLDYNIVGDTGGVKDVTLTAEQSGLREHQHIQNVGSTNGGALAGANGAGTPVKTTGVVVVDGVAYRDGAQDAQQAHENRPPFKTLKFLQKIV